MAKKNRKKPKIMSKIQKNKKYIPYYILGTIILLIILALYLGNNATPNNKLYFADRGIESLQANLKNSTQSKLDFEIKLAQERMEELRVVKYDKNATERIITEYKENLDNMKGYLGQMHEEGVDEDILTDTYLDLTQLYAESFVRTLKAQYKEAKEQNAESKEVIQEGIIATDVFVNDLFEFGVENITKSDKFDQYARELFQKLLRKNMKDIGYAEEDSLAIRPQATEEESQQLEDIINEAREIYFDTRDGLTKYSNKEIYENFKKVNKLVNEDVTDILVSISNRSLENSEDVEMEEFIEESESETSE
ncbi:hypothetical protein GF362_06120 [Candidatus Dojkabacteria bacterium]|nr:hypothetical protein [Candidatus Dojkabacteria bacterium]